MNSTPLAERMRPTRLDDLIGQEHLSSPKSFLYKAIKSGNVPSLILWGPPGVGKTTIANIIANEIKAPFYTLSAISSGVKDIREVIEKAKFQMGVVLFIDEIHRFNKSQQDALLGAVEKGIIRLIGATTENPSFEVNAALLSRCQVFTLNSLGKAELEAMIQQALEQDIELKKIKVELKESDALLRISGGDGRKLLNLLEIVIDGINENPCVITDDKVMQIAQQKVALYDKSGEQHYDIISAFIKSIRGSDPNAAVYWLARMIEGGEDVKFIARRLVILASEDIGNANPNALLLATNCFEAVKIIGYPEARIILSQCVTYLASSPKSNAAYMAINQAQSLVREKGDLSVPLHLRNAPTKLMKDLNYGKAYKYSHDFPGNFVNQEFLPEEIKGMKLYDPGQNARENELRKYLQSKWGEKYGY
ncbi:MAG TPA: AAA family ATPase [Algoriphagus sp.]|jgi:putative ATPase|uniref:replication-associated recombination protein A n=2 Tax=Algoriphagus TaxID=246875 RepID=UPI000C5D811C|nr:MULTISPECIES: replication-associated recombination protein A [unclassified Algoriphagus]MAL13942.1 AAA family ATPase [Algoriphagus sp.]MAN86913.1 AAA family ATPase [Algoriphagus sp.]QYH37299.1 replication-associated recombination protein A [Algoriphagus sp. NBT04N3]HAD51515.1 AAA family ATPase [Algoriphagus sp.]HAH38941.1 AAA family ATPase [Algoriphagus sp.]|tara:strand:- start:2322 stop:3584 length:1263 start_codon:yes stop_codon:yes gene_type:complete